MFNNNRYLMVHGQKKTRCTDINCQHFNFDCQANGQAIHELLCWSFIVNVLLSFVITQLKTTNYNLQLQIAL